MKAYSSKVRVLTWASFSYISSALLLYILSSSCLFVYHSIHTVTNERALCHVQEHAFVGHTCRRVFHTLRESWFCCSVLCSLLLLLLSFPVATYYEKAAFVQRFWWCLKKSTVKEDKLHCHCCNIRVCIWEWNIAGFSLCSWSVFIEAYESTACCLCDGLFWNWGGLTKLTLNSW